jgi:hypothetical protein
MKKIGVLRDEIHGTTQSMKSHVKKLKSDEQCKWRSEGNTIQFNSNTENMEDLTQSLWAIDNAKIDYARRADSIVLNDTSHSTAREAGKEPPLWADK